jgi:uncharacterized membrane protein YkoI
MFNPLKNLFRHLYLKPVKKVGVEFKKLFPHAINIEWTSGLTSDEAIFYQGEQEYIARFDKRGNLIDYNINLNITSLPAIVKEVGEKHGEIMNAISIYKRDGITGYEIIFRNDQLVRFTLLMNASGNILSIKEL